jgi:membrane-associated protein
LEQIQQIIDLFLHVDEHLAELFRDYGAWVYAILFVIVFCETGLVVTPFLPGDSLLFAAGALAAGKPAEAAGLMVLLTLAAVLGDAVNYACGAWIGPRVFKEKRRFLNKKYLDKTQRFYEKHGKKTIILARFVPIVRTFAPFVAGVGRMPYPQFFCYNVVGAVIWVVGFVSLGYAFGNIEIVKKHFSLVILGIIFVSVLPMAIEWMRSRKKESGIRSQGSGIGGQEPEDGSSGLKGQRVKSEN